MSEEDKYNTESLIKEMALLYANSKEIDTLLKNELSQKDIQPSKYYLLPKEWLEQYQRQFGYYSVINNINPYTISGYSNFKNRILNDKKYFSQCISNISIQIENREVTSPVPYELKNLTSSYIQNTVFPLDFFPVKEEIINEYTCQNFDFNNKDIFLYEIIIGDDNILAIDNKNKLNIFVCKYNDKDDKKCFNPCSLFSFQEEIGISEMIECACNKNGMNNYYRIKNINENGEIEQEINDKKGTLIGSFIPFKTKIRNDEGKTVLFIKGGNGKVSFSDSIIVNGEENTLSSNQTTTNNSNNTESINNSKNDNIGGNGNTLIINVDEAKKGQFTFKQSTNVYEEKIEDNYKSNKIKDNISLDTIKEENIDDSQSINPGVSVIKKSKRSSVKSNENQKKYIYNIMGEIYYYSYISKNSNCQPNLKNDVMISDIENINEKKVNNINERNINLNNDIGEKKNIINPMACSNPFYNNNNLNTCYNNNNILHKMANTYNQINLNINDYNNPNMNNGNNPNMYYCNNQNINNCNNPNMYNSNNQSMGNCNSQIMNNGNNQNMDNYNNQNMGDCNNPNMNNDNNSNMYIYNDQNMGNYNNQDIGNCNNPNVGIYNNQNMNNDNNQNMDNCNNQNINNCNGNQNINNCNMGNLINGQNMNGCNNIPNINNFGNQDMNIYYQNQNFDNFNGNQNSNMDFNGLNQNQNMNYFNSPTFNNGNQRINKENINAFNSNTNYINQNIRRFSYNLKESNNPQSIITLNLSSPNLTNFVTLEAKLDQNLSEIIQSQKLIDQRNIEFVKLNNRKLDLNKPLFQQGLYNNAKIDIFFKNN